MSKLATEYGISGKGLAKVCDRLNVPYPPRGYWAKKAAGKPVVTLRLPKQKDGAPNSTVIWRPPPPAPPPVLPPGVEQKIAKLTATKDTVVVSDRLLRPHKLVQKWLDDREERRRTASTPSQTLASGYGDCEDYALLRMAVLEAQGFLLQDMTVVILYDKKRHFYHAVLSVEIQGMHYILDNMRDQVLADSRLPDYQPLFFISNGRGFLHDTRTKGKAMAMKSFDSIAPGEGGEL